VDTAQQAAGALELALHGREVRAQRPDRQDRRLLARGVRRGAGRVRAALGVVEFVPVPVDRRERGVSPGGRGRAVPAAPLGERQRGAR
jgi:hypothetical protein